MTSKRPASRLPTQLRTERLILRPANVDRDSDCARVNYIRCNPAGGAGHGNSDGAEAARQLRYKNKVHGPRKELCTLSNPPSSIFWLMFLPDAAGSLVEADDNANLVGFIGMSFRQEMPYPDMGYTVTAAHAGHGYAAEGGKAVLSYWRDQVGVQELYIGCGEENLASQRCAERIGLVRAGTLLCEMGPATGVMGAVAYVLPGMQWKEGWVITPSRGWAAEVEAGA